MLKKISDNEFLCKVCGILNASQISRWRRKRKVMLGYYEFFKCKACFNARCKQLYKKNTEYYREISRKNEKSRSKRNSEKLTNRYIKNRINQRLNIKNPTKELIDFVRSSLLLKRKLGRTSLRKK